MNLRENTALEKFRNREISFADLPRRLRGDKEIALEAVKKDGTALQFASRKLQKVPSIIAVSKHTEEINRLETLKLNGTASKVDLHALYKEQLYENPEQYKNLPTWYFRDENAEKLAEINSKIGQALKDRVGEKVSEEDELYATNILTMMNETIREKRQETGAGGRRGCWPPFVRAARRRAGPSCWAASWPAGWACDRKGEI